MLPPIQINSRIETVSSYRPLRIESILEPVANFRLFTLEPCDGLPLDYQAGQYLTLAAHVGRQEIRRSYSLTSAPALGERPCIGVRRIENGMFSRWLFQLEPGNILQSAAVGGLFVLPADLTSDLVLLAAGTGITPIFSLLKSALHHYPHRRVTLLYSSQTPMATIFREELLTLAEARPNFSLRFFFSNHADLWRARINPELLLRLIDELSIDRGSLFYVCGPEAYMRMCIFTLREAGVADENIRKENFVVRSSPASFHRPPDMDQHAVYLHRGDISSLVHVRYPRSILDAGLEAGLAMPYSCKSGVCGNCVATCVSGRVWMSVNEVLTDNDLRKNLVLTCTGFPVAGDVHLQL